MSSNIEYYIQSSQQIVILQQKYKESKYFFDWLYLGDYLLCMMDVVYCLHGQFNKQVLKFL